MKIPKLDKEIKFWRNIAKQPLNPTRVYDNGVLTGLKIAKRIISAIDKAKAKKRRATK